MNQYVYFSNQPTFLTTKCLHPQTLSCLGSSRYGPMYWNRVSLLYRKRSDYVVTETSPPKSTRKGSLVFYTKTIWKLLCLSKIYIILMSKNYLFSNLSLFKTFSKRKYRIRHYYHLYNLNQTRSGLFERFEVESCSIPLTFFF